MWHSEPDISIVIPVFNEEESLPVLYGRLLGVLDSMDKTYELIFVDDGSQDGSGAFLESICDASANVKVIRLRRNFGQTAALTAGFDEAVGKVIITMDADLQNDAADIPRLLDKLDEGNNPNSLTAIVATVIRKRIASVLRSG